MFPLPSRPRRGRPLRLALASIPLLCLAVIGRVQSETDGVVYRAENLGLPNWAGMDYAPQISPDGRYLVFQSDRPGAREDRNLWFSMNLNSSDRLAQPRWTVPLPFFLPMEPPSTRTMRIIGGTHVLSEPAGAFSVNTDGFEGMAGLLYRNEKPVELFFTSMRGGSTGRDGYAGLNIYHSRFVADRWTPPLHLNAVNSHFNDRMPSVRLIRDTRDGSELLELLFASDRPGGFGGSDIWRSVRAANGQWSRPANLGSRVNSRYHEIAPKVNPTGGMLFYSSDRPGGFGHYDMYASRDVDGQWTEPKNLGRPFNSTRDDEYASFTADGLWLYFTSDRRAEAALGRFDMYRVRVPPWLRDPVSVLFTGLVLDGRTRLPLGVEATIKVHFERKTLVETSRIVRRPPAPDTTNFAISLSSGRRYQAEFSAPGFEPQSLILDYAGTLPTDRIDRRVIILQPLGEGPAPKRETTRSIRGRILDEAGGGGISGARAEIVLGVGKSMAYQTDAVGAFLFEVPVGARFTFKGSAPGFTNGRVRLQESPALKEAVLRLKKGGAAPPEDPCRKNMQECLDGVRIYFETDRATLRPSEKSKLATVRRVLESNPGVMVEILGYADRRASFEYNKGLSLQRARAVQEALVGMGVAAERLKLTGKSFLEPVCRLATTACRARNRRVEFKRLETKGR